MSRRIYLRAIMVIAIVAGIILIAEIARAQSASVSIDTIVFAPEGAAVSLREPTTPESLGLEAGALCNVSAVGVNQRSAHPGNDVQVGDAAAFVTLQDVEAFPNKTTIAYDGIQLVLPALISYVLIMGPDEVYSGGLMVEFDCPETPTTTTPTTTTTIPDESPTTTTTTPQATTTTTSPPPVDAPETGGGAMASVISGQDPGILAWAGWVAIGLGLTLAAWVGVSKLVEIVRARR